LDTRRVHICVGICTYKRDKLLGRLLNKLQDQETCGLFTYSIIVVDNDPDLSAEGVIASWERRSRIPIGYHVEPTPCIPLARNAAIRNARGDYIAFIDDDEAPIRSWLLNLYRACQFYGADGVLGPVVPDFEFSPPDWIIKGKILERKTYPTGTVLGWDETRTGNVLLRYKIFEQRENLFNPEFYHGEDKDFFRRMIAKGYKFIWCAEAPVYEIYQADRLKSSFFLKRALIRGGVSIRHQSYSIAQVIQSMIAFQIYALALPLLLIFGHHIFMKYLIKSCDHLGRLLAAAGVDLQKYINYS